MSLRRFGIISDTHGALHPRVFDIFQGVEAIIHAGDLGDPHIYSELRILASVHAVCGNVDYQTPELPAKRVVELPFGNVGISHGHLHPADREQRAKALLATFDKNGVRLIVHGHSHQQLLDNRNGIWIVNPGSAGRPRLKTTASVCVLEWDSDSDLLRFDFQPLSWS